MLQTVKTYIAQTNDCVSFEEFFDSYVMAVQDTNIVSEIKYNIHRNNSTVLDMERLAHDQHERLVNSN